jgi:hypothetical protein
LRVVQKVGDDRKGSTTRRFFGPGMKQHLIAVSEFSSVTQAKIIVVLSLEIGQDTISLGDLAKERCAAGAHAVRMVVFRQLVECMPKTIVVFGHPTT